ncbi:30S ribosomal protein S7 [Planctomycetota bacterium]
MARIFKSTERFLQPDPRYGNMIVSKFINCMMWKGKKAVSQKIFYNAMDIIENKVKEEKPLAVFLAALENVKPMIEVRSRRVGGQNLQVPVEVSSKRRQSLGIRWMLDAMRSGKGKPAHEKLAGEILAAYKKEGTAITKRENVHKMAEANKAFAHFAW